MPSPEAEKLIGKLRKFKSTNAMDLEKSRAFLEDSADAFTVPETVTCSPVDVDGVPGEWLTPAEVTERGVLLYLHGGGYTIGSIKSHRHMVAELAVSAGLRALMLDYRLGPEYPFPAAIDDSLTAYKWLLTQGHQPEEIVIGGDSAGGGLSLATMLILRDEHTPLPACAILLSPWVDLTNTLPSHETKAQEDPRVTNNDLALCANWYLNGQDPAQPLASPMHADLSGLPPILIQVGTAEILLDDSIQLAQKAEAEGVDIQLDIWEDMFHVWQFNVQVIPEAQEAIDELAAFARSKVG